MTTLNFTWKDHGNRAVSHMSSFLGKADYSDVKFFCKGRLIPAHKLVLIAASPYFEKLFSELPPSEMPIIIVRDAEPELVEYILAYIYAGVANVPCSVAEKFLSLSLDFQLRGLERKAQDVLRHKIRRLVETGSGSDTAGSSSSRSQQEVPNVHETRKRRNEPQQADTSAPKRRETRDGGTSAASLALSVPLGMGWEDRAEGGIFDPGASPRGGDVGSSASVDAENLSGIRRSARSYPSVVRAAQNGDMQQAARPRSRGGPGRRSVREATYSIVGTDASAVLGATNGNHEGRPSPKITLRRGGAGGSSWAVDSAQHAGRERRPSPSPGRSSVSPVPGMPINVVRPAVVKLRRICIPPGVTTVGTREFWAANTALAREEETEEFNTSADEMDAHPDRVPKLIDRSRPVTNEHENIWKGFTSAGSVLYFCGFCEFKGLSMTEEAYNHHCS